jgi:hypothetical protein
MKISKSATQAAAPLSSPGSSAIGFEAPFQYAVTSADAVQMYQFRSVTTPSQTLDTNKPADQDAILAELPLMDRLGFWRLYEGIMVEDSPSSSDWIARLEHWLGGEGAHPSYERPHPYYLNQIIEHASDSEGIWSKGNVFFSYGVRRETQYNRNTLEEKAGGRYHKPDQKSREHHNSRNDSEVATLTQLYDLITQDLPAEQAGGQATHPLVLSSSMGIGVYSSMGPCNGCQDRIGLFWEDVQTFVSGLRLTHPVEIVFSVFYQSAREGVERRGSTTDYGYAYDDVTALDEEDPDAEQDDRRFVKVYKVTVPEYKTSAPAPASGHSSSSSSSSSPMASGSAATAAAAAASATYNATSSSSSSSSSSSKRQK